MPCSRLGSVARTPQAARHAGRAGGSVRFVLGAWIAIAWGDFAPAQNDWQFPDPYFGILEIEKSAPRPPVVRRSRPEFQPAPQPAPSRGRHLRARRRHGPHAPYR